ncbi:prostaglandin G/H synthase 1-like isoform X1 [Chelmon rostratus]|uniref:prostaglandin G/H synthase 1-like isoform X1 n=1 Tax=Chelmon rostratus TaxID=109905 RepID=UPI001BE8128E|nr:prostaglandin G/H synthase 1-like isoform X1 [Chelmon rostratus]
MLRPRLNPCCYYPCQNSGVCVRFDADRYECDCTGTGFHGENCSVPEFWTRVGLMLKPNPSVVDFFLTHFNWFWDFVNNSFLRDMLMEVVLKVRTNLIPSPPTYNSKYGYLNWEYFYNLSYYTRILPPVPQDCPLPMGTKGKAVLPDPKVLAERFFKRTKFRPDPQGANLMLVFMAQHFTHQFFKTDHKTGSSFTKALGHGVESGNIYGDNLMRQLQLRLHKDGKLKHQLVNGEMYPPTVSEVPVHMVYPEGIPPEQRLAIGQETFGMLPGLTMYATIWLREHNRVCDILKAEHPTWDDEQLFQTTRLIIIGETIRIIIEEYVQQLSGYLLKLKFDPPMLFNSPFQYSNRIALEFCQLYHWHPLMPDSFQIGGGQNSHEIVLKVAEMVIRESRATRVQPFNEYRKKFNLKPYTSFYEFTDDLEMARGLEELYGDIDALEFYPGIVLEKTRANGIFGESMVEMGAPFSLKGLLGNPICSPEYWKPSTFGGETGFSIVKTATLKKLVCLNTKWCPYVDFHVPRNEEEAKPRKPSTEL